jgi:hypothetical protein
MMMMMMMKVLSTTIIETTPTLYRCRRGGWKTRRQSSWSRGGMIINYQRHRQCDKYAIAKRTETDKETDTKQDKILINKTSHQSFVLYELTSKI